MHKLAARCCNESNYRSRYAVVKLGTSILTYPFSPGFSSLFLGGIFLLYDLVSTSTLWQYSSSWLSGQCLIWSHLWIKGTQEPSWQVNSLLEQLENVKKCSPLPGQLSLIMIHFFNPRGISWVSLYTAMISSDEKLIGFSTGRKKYTFYAFLFIF